MAWMESPQARRFAVAVLVALGLALVLTALSGSGADTAAGRLGGDYPAFYAAGRIAADSGLDDVNDLAHLEAAQVDLFPASEADEGFLTWAYPPHVALAYRPLAALPYRASYLVHTALMVAAFCVAAVAARSLLPWLRGALLPAIAVGLAFFPMLRGIGSGQNTALTLLLLVAAWRASAGGRDGWAGLALGLLLFKPQFAGLALLGWLVGGRWRVLPTFVATGAGTWALTAALAGTDWVQRWLDDLDAYRGTEGVNGPNHVSLSEAADAAFGVGAVGWVAAAVVLGLALRRFRLEREGGLSLPLATLVPVLLLAAAHAVFYDVGLVLLTAAVLVQAGRARAVVVLLLLGFVDPLKETLDWNPGVLVLLGWFVVALLTPTTSPAPEAVHSSA